MAISYINQTTATNSGTSITVNKPTNTADGDLLVAGVSIEYDTTPRAVSAAPSGWSLMTDTPQRATDEQYAMYTYIYYKTASGEGADYTWNFSGASKNNFVTIATYREAAIGGGATNTKDTDWNTTIVAPDISVVESGCWVITVLGTRLSAYTYTAPAGYSLRTSTAANKNQLADSNTTVSAGTVSPGTWTSTGVEQGVAFSMYIKPAAAPVAVINNAILFGFNY